MILSGIGGDDATEEALRCHAKSDGHESCRHCAPGNCYLGQPHRRDRDEVRGGGKNRPPAHHDPADRAVNVGFLADDEDLNITVRGLLIEVVKVKRQQPIRTAGAAMPFPV